jgi:phosphatidylserine/phosphatidylglycerophosphate/cardiolipin synthase-like enzyme
VVVTDSAVLVGSVNLTLRAIESGSIEAAAICTDPDDVRRATEWFMRLMGRSTPLTTIWQDPQKRDELLAARSLYLGYKGGGDE